VKASGLPSEPVGILSVMPWVMSPKVARRYRIGRIFLVGDAAARLSPTGGLGLNTGLQSAHNLAWKLAALVKGGAGAGLLDTYEEGKRPVEPIIDRRRVAEGLMEQLRSLGLFGPSCGRELTDLTER
jgi:putative polyketide hydroxylase